MHPGENTTWKPLLLRSWKNSNERKWSKLRWEYIAEVDGFTPVCLNPDVVETANYQYIPDQQFH